MGSGTVQTHWDVCRLAVAVRVTLRDLQSQGHRWWGANIELGLQFNPEPALALLAFHFSSLSKQRRVAAALAKCQRLS